MDAIEKRALIQLGELLKFSGGEGELQIGRDFGKALIAEIANLTPPEGYMLVDARLLGAVRVARLAILQKQAEAEQRDEPHDASMWAECAADLDEIAPRGTQAARPEVP